MASFPRTNISRAKHRNGGNYRVHGTVIGCWNLFSFQYVRIVLTVNTNMFFFFYQMKIPQTATFCQIKNSLSKIKQFAKPALIVSIQWPQTELTCFQTTDRSRVETLPDATSFGPSTQSNFDPSELHPRPCKKCNCNRTGPVSYFLFLLQRPWDDVRSWCVRTRKSDIRHLQTSATNSKAVGGVLSWSKLRNLNISFFTKLS